MSSYDNPLDEIRGILEKEGSHQIDPELTPKLQKNSSISSEKMLLNYISDSPRIFHTTMSNVFHAKVAVHTKLSDGFKKAYPIVLILGLVMAVAIVMGNAPTLVDSIAKNFGVEKRIEVERVTEVQIVHLTPEEAAAQGIKVEETPPGVTPDAIDRGEDAPVIDPVEEEVVNPTGNPRLDNQSEGFDIAGNLVPKPIPFTTGNTAENAKTCDTDNGYHRYWIETDTVPEEITSNSTYVTNTSRNTSALWVCLSADGYNTSLNGELISEEQVSTFEARN